jgi:hypothetical protein
MLGTNALLEECLSYTELYGFKLGGVLKMNGQAVEIKQLVLSDEDWEILEMFISHKRASINLAFVVTLCHFPEKFNYDNLKIFMDCGNRAVSRMAKEMFVKINTDAGDKEREDFAKDLWHELSGGTVLA